MPYKIVKKKSCYQVINRTTKHKHSKCSTKRNAKRQYRLLNAIEHNPDFKLRSSRSRRKK